MAYIVPDDLARLALAGAHRGEIETLQRLKTGLGPGFTIYHGVHWTRAYENRTAFGEIDFAIVNRSGRVLVVEQKNGALIEAENELLKRYPDGEKSVNRQLRRNLDEIRGKFRECSRAGNRLDADYLLYCPDYRIVRLNAAGLDAERIVDASRAQKLCRIVHAILGEACGDGTGPAEDVHCFFRDSFEVVPDIHAHIDAQQRSFSRLTGALADILRNIEMAPMRLRVKGAAGCGKTSLAVDFFQRAAAAGKRPLLLCYNRPLRDRLNAVLPDTGVVQTRYGLTAKFLEDRGYDLRFEERRGNPGFWAEMEDRLLEFGIPEEWKFDTLVVDEGQDFDDDALERFRLFLRDDHDILWLEDADQNVRGADPFAAGGFVTYRARGNYRSPESIARFVRAALPFDFEPASDIPGLGVGITGYDDAGDQPRLAAKLADGLIRQGFKADDIALVTMRGQNSSPLSGCDRLGPFTVRHFAGYDDYGNQMMTDGQLHFDSVRRFKGLQAPAVILCDVDPDPERLEEQRMLYCGMTRATVRLELLANRANPFYEKCLLRGAAPG